MKKVVLTLIAGLSMQVAFAQKAMLTSAILDFRNGKLDKAKTEIDQAAANDKSAAMAKTWFYRGEIYTGLMDNPVYSKNAPADAPKIAYEAYDKYLQMEPKGEFYKTATQKRDNLYFVIVNQGANFHNDKQYDKALESFALAIKMRPADTTAYSYAVNTAGVKEDHALEKSYARKLIDLNYQPLDNYKRLIYITEQIEKDKNGTLKLIEEARVKYPNDKDLMTDEARLYMETGRGQEAITKLEAAAAVETDAKRKSTLLTNVAILHDKNKKPEAALPYYQQAITADPTNLVAQYNLGIYYNNKAADIYNKVNKMSMAEYGKSGKKLETEAKGYSQKAVPYLEAALKLNPDDTDVMYSLSKIYLNLGRTADAEKMNKMMDQAKGKGKATKKK